MSSDNGPIIAGPVPIGKVVEALQTAQARGVTHVTRNRVYNLTLFREGEYVGYLDMLFGDLELFEDDEDDDYSSST
jgi:hypothetical protein